MQELPDYIGHRQRIRERFLKTEGRDMADYELLELVLMQAIPRKDVKPLAKKLINTFGCLANVITAPDHKLREIKGIGDACIIMLKIAKVTAQRLCWENLASDDLPILFNIDSLVEYCRGAIAYADVEELHVIYLDSKLKVIGKDILQRGNLTSVTISPREIVKSAINQNAAGIIMIHNHPSGLAVPSENDKALTLKVEQACNLMNLKLHEHIIITKEDYFSFVEHQLLNSLK